MAFFELREFVQIVNLQFKKIKALPELVLAKISRCLAIIFFSQLFLMFFHRQDVFNNNSLLEKKKWESSFWIVGETVKLSKFTKKQEKKETP